MRQLLFERRVSIVRHDDLRKKVLLAHPFGNANVRQALTALSSDDLLAGFVTSLYAEGVPFRNFLPRSLRDELWRRSFSMLRADQVEWHPTREILRLISSRYQGFTPHLTRLTPTVDDIWRSIDRQLAKDWGRRIQKPAAIYAYEDGAFLSFSEITTSKKIYELPIGYWRAMHAILREESSLSPAWASTIAGLSDSEEKLRRKDVELELSDVIVVPSDFVKFTLPPAWREKTVVVPYGCPSPVSEANVEERRNSPLKVLFCGSLGQRKGISYLFQAAEEMRGRIELTVIGSPVAQCATLVKALQRVNWHRSLANEKVLELMRAHDVFVFPTLFEGRALVVLEALSQGLPVITTANSGASDVVINGESGFIIPIRSVESIVAALQLLDRDRELLAYMKQQSLLAAARTSWQSYRRKLLSLVRRTLDGPEL